jgi:predicted nucleotide-binding protein
MVAEALLMRIARTYNHVIFKPEIIKDALGKFETHFPAESNKEAESYRSITVEQRWMTYDSDEEFFSDYRRGFNRAHYTKDYEEYGLDIIADEEETSVEVWAKTRPEIESVFEQFESHVPESRLPEPEPIEAPTLSPVIFIGHGHSEQWVKLKDHLHEQHGYKVTAYEVGARAGHSIRDVLEKMLTESSFAILVMTAEDKDADGHFRARQNVIHELGLFQGRLGFSRAIAVIEQDVESLSNMSGIQEIRYAKGNIKETFGDVLAALRNEFGDRR